MLTSRRSLLALVAAVPLASSLPALADEASVQTDRAIGKADAPATIGEYFSLTCTHCANFAAEVFPEIKAKLIDTGKVRWVFHDFPLDQAALTAAMVAHYLPPERYEPFVMALFASQDRWAFARDVNITDELWKMAALAGMSRQTFDKAISDTALKTWILKQQTDAQNRWGIDATPSFVINGKEYSGEMPYDAFVKLIPGA